MTHEKLPSPDQVRAARGLLSWTRQDLAERAGVDVAAVVEIELDHPSLLPKDARAIRRAVESAGVQFTETGAGYGFHWTFMMDSGMSHMIIDYTPNATRPILEFLSVFGEFDPPRISIDLVQCATTELKARVVAYVDQHGQKSPNLFAFRKKITDLSDGEFFLFLPHSPTSTAEQFQYEQVLESHNHPQTPPPSDDQLGFEAIFEQYDLCIPRTDKPVKIGNAKKANRTCRFCGGTQKKGARFDKEAHALSAALGNKYLKLADECDECNQYFGDYIEPALVELLNIQRVFLGIESRGTLPTVNFSDGSMFRDAKDEKLMVVIAKTITEDAFGGLSVQLGSGTSVVPQNFYRTLCKIALSVIPEMELSGLTETTRWVRYGGCEGKDLPTIATAVVDFPADPSAQIALYIRKEPHATMPHVVCEFRLGCYLYVYVLPFSQRDEGNLVGYFEAKDFKQIFRHYRLVPSWRHQDFSGDQPFEVSQNIKLTPNRMPGTDKP